MNIKYGILAAYAGAVVALTSCGTSNSIGNIGRALQGSSPPKAYSGRALTPVTSGPIRIGDRDYNGRRFNFRSDKPDPDAAGQTGYVVIDPYNTCPDGTLEQYVKAAIDANKPLFFVGEHIDPAQIYLRGCPSVLP